jgi:hypothetical protein
MAAVRTVSTCASAPPESVRLRTANASATGAMAVPAVETVRAAKYQANRRCPRTPRASRQVTGPLPSGRPARTGWRAPFPRSAAAGPTHVRGATHRRVARDRTPDLRLDPERCVGVDAGGTAPPLRQPRGRDLEHGPDLGVGVRVAVLRVARLLPVPEGAVPLGQAPVDLLLTGFLEQPGPVQQTQVVGRVGLRDAELPSHFGGAQCCAGQEREHLEPERVGGCAQPSHPRPLTYQRHVWQYAAPLPHPSNTSWGGRAAVANDRHECPFPADHGPIRPLVPVDRAQRRTDRPVHRS